VLCWYQRIAMFPLVVILGLGLFEGDDRSVRHAWPLAWAGCGMALYHCMVFWGLVSAGLTPCGKGPSCADANLQVAGWLPIPLLSLSAFTAVLMLLWLAGRKATS